MGNQFVTRHYQLNLPDAPAPEPNKTLEAPAHRPNVAKFMPGEKKPTSSKPKTLKHHRWTGKRKRRGKPV
jgi:hypothetical protein